MNSLRFSSCFAETNLMKITETDKKGILFEQIKYLLEMLKK